jgi:transcriptional regulator with XRE-family HTH domain
MKLKNFVRKRRKELGLLMKEISYPLGYSSNQSVWNWEHGRAPIPYYMFRQLAKLLDVRLETLIDLAVEDYRDEFTANVRGAR